MKKQDVLDAINATIVENGTKAITAQSLNNVLTMMTENAGEGGSGDGALRVIVPELIVLGQMMVETGELSPSSWAAMRQELNASIINGIDLSEYEEVVNASFAHNANVAQQILAKAKAGQGVSVVLDQTPYIPTALSIQFQITPELAAQYGDFAACVVQPAALSMEYVKLTPEVEEASDMAGEQLMCSLTPLAPPTLSEYSTLYPSNMEIILNLDGSLHFEVIEEEQPSSESGVVFYTTVSGEITEEQKEKNVAAFSKYASGIPVSVIVNAEGQEGTYYPFTTSHQENKDEASGLSFVVCNFPLKKSDGSYTSMFFYEDGSVIMQME